MQARTSKSIATMIVSRESPCDGSPFVLTKGNLSLFRASGGPLLGLSVSLRTCLKPKPRLRRSYCDTPMFAFKSPRGSARIFPFRTYVVASSQVLSGAHQPLDSQRECGCFPSLRRPPTATYDYRTQELGVRVEVNVSTGSQMRNINFPNTAYSDHGASPRARSGRARHARMAQPAKGKGRPTCICMPHPLLERRDLSIGVIFFHPEVLERSGTVKVMLLSDRDLKIEIDSGRLDISPFDESLLQPSSIDVLLDTQFRTFNNGRYTHIDPAECQDDLTSLVDVGDGPFVLHPGEFVLGSTYESVTLSDSLAARMEGKSSLGRLGLLTHSTAGFIDPGFSGPITLELSNVANLPITLWPGMKIGQLCFFKLSSPSMEPYGSERYGSRYQHQRGPTASKSWKDFRRFKK